MGSAVASGSPAESVNAVKVALVANTSWYLSNFRSNLMKALCAAGYDVVAVAPAGHSSAKLAEAGFRFRPFVLDQISTNPVSELRSVLSLRRIFLSERPDFVLSYTPKGNIYSALVLPRDTRLIVNVSGLGRSFSGESKLRIVTRQLFRIAFARATTVLFQNNDDLREMIELGNVNPAKAICIPGSGVDLERFRPMRQELRPPQEVTFLLIARLLWQKGLQQFVEAAQEIRARFPKASFQVMGPLEKDNPDSVPASTLDRWQREGLITYLGVVDDVAPYIATADCIVLPSFYREGVPRSLLEGAAMAKPVITTDMPGCRDAVEDGVTGYLCRPRDSGDLVRKMFDFVQLDREARTRMGMAARSKMERSFDEQIVIRKYLDLVSAGTAARN